MGGSEPKHSDWPLFICIIKDYPQLHCVGEGTRFPLFTTLERVDFSGINL